MAAGALIGPVGAQQTAGTIGGSGTLGSGGSTGFNFGGGGGGDLFGIGGISQAGAGIASANALTNPNLLGIEQLARLDRLQRFQRRGGREGDIPGIGTSDIGLLDEEIERQDALLRARRNAAALNFLSSMVNNLTL